MSLNDFHFQCKDTEQRGFLAMLLKHHGVKLQQKPGYPLILVADHFDKKLIADVFEKLQDQINALKPVYDAALYENDMGLGGYKPGRQGQDMRPVLPFKARGRTWEQYPEPKFWIHKWPMSVEDVRRQPSGLHFAVPSPTHIGVVDARKALGPLLAKGLAHGRSQLQVVWPESVIGYVGDAKKSIDQRRSHSGINLLNRNEDPYIQTPVIVGADFIDLHFVRKARAWMICLVSAMENYMARPEHHRDQESLRYFLVTEFKRLSTSIGGEVGVSAEAGSQVDVTFGASGVKIWFALHPHRASGLARTRMSESMIQAVNALWPETTQLFLNGELNFSFDPTVLNETVFERSRADPIACQPEPRPVVQVHRWRGMNDFGIGRGLTMPAGLHVALPVSEDAFDNVRPSVQLLMESHYAASSDFVYVESLSNLWQGIEIREPEPVAALAKARKQGVNLLYHSAADRALRVPSWVRLGTEGKDSPLAFVKLARRVVLALIHSVIVSRTLPEADRQAGLIGELNWFMKWFESNGLAFNTYVTANKGRTVLSATKDDNTIQISLGPKMQRATVAGPDLIMPAVAALYPNLQPWIGPNTIFFSPREVT